MINRGKARVRKVKENQRKYGTSNRRMLWESVKIHWQQYTGHCISGKIQRVALSRCYQHRDKNESCTGATKGTKGTKEGEQMARIRISYETPEELEKVKKLLLLVIKSCKVSKNNRGRYKKAYIEISER